MFCFKQQFQVFAGVVPSVAVLVVNNLSLGKIPTDHFFHYQPVLHNVTLAVGKRVAGNQSGVVVTTSSIGNSFALFGIEIPNSPSHIVGVALLGAELFPGQLGLCRGKCLVAGWANDINLSAVTPTEAPVTLLAAIPALVNSVLIKLKFFPAVIAISLHGTTISQYTPSVKDSEEHHCENEIAAKRLAQEVLKF